MERWGSLSFVFLILLSGTSSFRFLEINSFVAEELKTEFKKLDSECGLHLQAYLTTLASLNNTAENQWAFRMLDSTAKIPEGILTGNLVEIGQFDECIAVEYPTGEFKGKHCMLSIAASFSGGKSDSNKMRFLSNRFQGHNSREFFDAVVTINLQFGICVPSTCTAEDLNFLLESSLSQSVFNASADDLKCWTNDPRELSSGSWGFIAFCIILGALAALSTSYETYQLFGAKNNKPNRVLSSFSLYSNTKGLLEVRPSGEMDCLHGIRSLSMMWVMICHTYAIFLNAPLINLTDVGPMTSDVNHILISNGFFSVDSFFFLSGLLVAFVFFRNIGRKGYFDVPTSIIHRYLRLTPSYMVMIFFTVTLLEETNKGPLWHSQISPGVEVCRDDWWSGIIYLQNYINPLGSCLGQSWYLSADMQMFWISPIILYPLYLWPVYGISFLALLILASTLWTMGLGISNNIAANLLLMSDFEQFSADYVPTHTRIMPWLVGLALGFAICAIKARKVQVRLTKAVVALGWLLSAGICLGILYSVRRFQNNPDATEVESAIYASFSRTGWGIGLAWVVFACIYGYGGVVNSFLSLGVFQPLGKLSYNTYLIHMTILAYRQAILRTHLYVTDFNIVFEFFGVLILSNLFSIILYLLVEAPVANLDRELLNPIKILPYPKSKPQKQKMDDKVEKGEVPPLDNLGTNIDKQS